MAAEEAKTKKDKLSSTLATAFTIMLLAATITTAYSVWQASVYNSQGGSSSSKANGLRSLSNSYLSEGLIQRNIDANTFINWVTAVSNNDNALASFIEERFREEFRPAFYAWLGSTNTTEEIPPGTPFDRPEYKNANIEMSQQISLEIDALAAESDLYGKYSNRLVLVTVLTATVVFLSSLESKIERSKYLKILILAVAIALFLVGWSIIISIPHAWSY